MSIHHAFFCNVRAFQSLCSLHINGIAAVKQQNVGTCRGRKKKSAVPLGCHQDAALLRLSQVEGGSSSRMKASLQHTRTASALAMQPESGQNVQLEDCSSSLQNTAQRVLSLSATPPFPPDYISTYVIHLCSTSSFEEGQNLIVLIGHISLL